MSKTYSLAVIGLVTAVAPLLGFELTDSAALEQVVSAVIFIGIAIDRLLKKDISIIGLRKR